jgi:hypothetical protein
MSHVPYASVVGCLMYVMICTRLDIAHAVRVISRYISKLGKDHWKTIKRVFKYFHETTTYGLCYQGRPRLDIVLKIHGFVDADSARDLNSKISTIGYVLTYL